MMLHIVIEDPDLPQMRELLHRALNTWDPALHPKWAQNLVSMVDQRLDAINGTNLSVPEPITRP